MKTARFLVDLEGAFATAGVPVGLAKNALEGARVWLGRSDGLQDLDQLVFLLESGRIDALVDAFYQVIPFGTGGRRGAVGLGPNRINPFTVCSSVQGHAQYLRKRFPHRDLSVVIAYDVRVFEDARGVYDPHQPCSVRGLSSRDFAEMAAEVYAGNGVKVTMLPRNSGTWLSTPELSFAIRFLQAQGGLNLSASHNPPDDNGAKVYNHHGGQEIPPFDAQLVDEVSGVETVQRLAWSEALAKGTIVFLPSSLHEAYIALNLALSVEGSRSAKIVFTPLHGTADSSLGAVLRAAGFEMMLEPEQSRPDGQFPTVPFGAPNPEVHQAMERAIRLAESLQYDLVMACDPDADRLGVVVKTAKGWRPLTGNEIAVLVTYAALKGPRKTSNSVVMRTEVTTALVSRLAHAHGVQVVDHLLVGFKYIGDGIRALEESGQFGPAIGKAEDFLVGVEESHGVLVTPGIRDKDAAGGALLLAELASSEKDQGRNLVHCLEAIWAEHGCVANVLISTVMRGAAGRQNIEAIQASLRENPPLNIGGRAVNSMRDHQDPTGIHGPIRSDTDFASRNVLSYELEGGARIVVRPSGTEPKTKVYAELFGTPGQSQSDLTAACRELAHVFARDMMNRIGLSLPPWTQHMSDLLAVEHRLHFANQLLPQLEAALQSEEDVERLLDAGLSNYGRDPRALVAGGVQHLLKMRNRQNDPLERLLKLLLG
jgi:phosphoglucomutase